LAFILVGLVVFLFLGDWRSTIIPAIAVPVSLVGTLFYAILRYFLNHVVCSGIAIGVVDDAIVVIEAVHAKMEEEHLSPLKATKKRCMKLLELL
jgi:HAE1 family hydrophobic/amphiphilic exporter-1